MKFKKEELVKAKKFLRNKDLLNALLEKDKDYSIEEVEAIIKKFFKKEVR